MFALLATCSGLPHARAAAPAAADPDVAALVEANRQLADEVRAQQKTIEALTARLNELAHASARQDEALKHLEESGDANAPAPVADEEHQVRVGGEMGLAFFSTGSLGPFPKSEFRVDDALLTIEAPIWHRTYFFGEMRLLTREANTEAPQLGELYVDFENVSELWGHPDALGFRAGRINTPFGEEYQVRGPLGNPLISHSLSDLWGQDEGMEIYGALGPLHYVLAVQNGGISRLRDFDADKAVVGRIGWDPRAWLHLSASAMRTGDLAATGDGLSDLWFGDGFFRSIGSAGTSAFWADLAEADVIARWQTGHVHLAGGAIRYDDNDASADNRRSIRYGYLEVVQNITERLYGAARYSAITAPDGYPIVGAGTADYLFRSVMTKDLRRLSLGFGFRFSEPLVLKLEYSWNSGRLVGGVARQHQDFFGTEVGLKF